MSAPEAPNDDSADKDLQDGDMNEGARVYEAAHLFTPRKSGGKSLSSTGGENDTPSIKPDEYPNLAKNPGLMKRVCRAYVGHVMQIRSGVRLMTTIILRHDDPMSLRAEVRQCINDLDRCEGGLIGFSRSILIEGGTASRSSDEPNSVDENIGPVELQGLVTRLEREMDVDAAVGEDEGTYSIRRPDSSRIVPHGIMQQIDGEEKPLVLKYLDHLSALGKERKTVPQYIADKLGIVVTRPQK
ncbi:MAG: hypothetical protein NTX63_01280 [Candidatus Peregrinibacteria bacterium]|nr:hypothetical protein [Candidatus Peregrinibacteria bacterium]